MSCDELVKSCGSSVDEIIEKLHNMYNLALSNTGSEKIKADVFLLKLYECMHKDFKAANPEKEISLPAYRTKSGITKRVITLLAMYVAFKNGAGAIPKHKLDQLNGTDNQAPRHMQRSIGLKIRGDWIREESNRVYTYELTSLELGEAYSNRHVGIKTSDFEEIKEHYGYRCATCGAKEGELHHLPQYRAKGQPVELQRGHMNPHKPLEKGNIIPQCQFCNKPYKSNVVFDANGRVIGVASWDFVLKSIEKDYLRVSEESVQRAEEVLELIRSKIDYFRKNHNNAGKLL